MKTTDELNSELSKHRKLLHRAVGNRIVPHINYHHYEIVRIIEEIEKAEKEAKYVFGLPLIGIPDSHGDIMSPELLGKVKKAHHEWNETHVSISPMSNLSSIKMMYHDHETVAGRMLRESYLKAEDQFIFTGNFNTSTSADGTHLDTHISKK